MRHVSGRPAGVRRRQRPSCRSPLRARIRTTPACPDRALTSRNRPSTTAPTPCKPRSGSVTDGAGAASIAASSAAVAGAGCGGGGSVIAIVTSSKAPLMRRRADRDAARRRRLRGGEVEAGRVDAADLRPSRPRSRRSSSSRAGCPRSRVANRRALVPAVMLAGAPESATLGDTPPTFSVTAARGRVARERVRAVAGLVGERVRARPSRGPACRRRSASENVGPLAWLRRPWRGGAMILNARAPRPIRTSRSRG